MRDSRNRAPLLALGVSAAAMLLAPLIVRGGQVDPQDFTQLDKGRYLAILGDCASCHTVPGGRAYAGGLAIETPFGDVVAANITPDPETGIGAWSDDDFDNAVRRGRRPDGSRLYPAMPYNAYTRMSREEVLELRAYLNSVPAVKNAVLSDTLPFPFDVRASVGLWDALYFTEGAYQPDPKMSPEWNRGAYLVTGPGHCGACHTAKSFLGGDKSSRALQGSLLQGWYAPNITANEALGVGRWSSDDVVSYLKSGHNRVSAASGLMAEVVELSTSHMTDADLAAIATYLKSVGGGADVRTALNAGDARMVAGQAIYRDQCSACHGLEGHGIRFLFPAVADSPAVRADDPATLIRIVLRGSRSVATAAEPTAPGMPSYATQLDDTQVAAVLTYIRNAWGSGASAVSPDVVARARSLLARRAD